MKGPEHLYVTLPLAFIFFSSRPAARFIFAISLAISSPRPMPEALALPHFASAAGAPANSTNAASAQPPSAIPNKLFIASPPAGHGQRHYGPAGWHFRARAHLRRLLLPV